MPTNKDFKRLVRARMQKTGEAYTAARAQLLEPKHLPLSTPQDTPIDYPTLAGMSDVALKAKTGCTWDRWVWALDRVKAHQWPHPEIAKYVQQKYKVSSWWAQTVTVGYERIKGLRVVGQRRGGGFVANKSQTFALPLARLYHAFSDKRTRNRWLPGVELRIRSATREKYLRVLWPDATSVELGFFAKGKGRSQVQIQHNSLPDQAAAIRAKEFWAERLTALGDLQREHGRPRA